jgi:hypothetical protein
MKYSLLVLSMLLPFLSFAGTQQQHFAAYNLQTAINEYSIALDEVRQDADLTSPQENDLIARDLALCHAIGRSNDFRSRLDTAGGKLSDMLQDLNDRLMIDASSATASQQSAQMLGFCLRGYNGKYRDIPSLKSALDILYQDLNNLKTKIVNKYL